MGISGHSKLCFQMIIRDNLSIKNTAVLPANLNFSQLMGNMSDPTAILLQIFLTADRTISNRLLIHSAFCCRFP